MFKIKDENDLITAVANYQKAGQERCDEADRDYVEKELDVTKYVNYDSQTVGISKRCHAALVLIPF